MSIAYKLENIEYSYPNQINKAIDNFSYSITKGKTTALLGPNGAGKSTLMDLLLGWKTPSKGTLSLFDKPLKSYSRKKLAQMVSLVPQQEVSRFAFTVKEYVLFGRSPYINQFAMPTDDDLKIVDEVLKKVGLNEIENRSITSLSSGEKQLLLLARSLAQQPKVMLLDEPTSNLDPYNTSKLISILNLLAKEEITLFFTTHDPQIASEIADQIVMIKNGTLFFSGTKEEVLNSNWLSSLYATEIETFLYKDKIIALRSL
jgi:iron complex transport system ATP-binding protein